MSYVQTSVYVTKITLLGDAMHNPVYFPFQLKHFPVISQLIHLFFGGFQHIFPWTEFLALNLSVCIVSDGTSKDWTPPTPKKSWCKLLTNTCAKLCLNKGHKEFQTLQLAALKPLMLWFSHPFSVPFFSWIFVPKHPTGSLARIVVFYHHPSNWATGPVDFCEGMDLWFNHFCCNRRFALTQFRKPMKFWSLLYEKDIHWKIGERSPKWRTKHPFELQLALHFTPTLHPQNCSSFISFSSQNKTHHSSSQKNASTSKIFHIFPMAIYLSQRVVLLC